MNYLYTYLLGATPVIELRGAIPVGYLHYQLGIIPATILGILGGLTLALFCLAALPVCMKVLRYVPPAERLMEKLLKRTRKQYSHKMTVWGEVFLVLLVSIPLPGSGAFTGSLIAYLFGIKTSTAFMLISIGVIISGLLVAALTLSGEGLWSLAAKMV